MNEYLKEILSHTCNIWDLFKNFPIRWISKSNRRVLFEVQTLNTLFEFSRKKHSCVCVNFHSTQPVQFTRKNLQLKDKKLDKTYTFDRRKWSLLFLLLVLFIFCICRVGCICIATCRHFRFLYGFRFYISITTSINFKVKYIQSEIQFGYMPCLSFLVKI